MQQDSSTLSKSQKKRNKKKAKKTELTEGQQAPSPPAGLAEGDDSPHLAEVAEAGDGLQREDDLVEGDEGKTQLMEPPLEDGTADGRGGSQLAEGEEAGPQDEEAAVLAEGSEAGPQDEAAAGLAAGSEAGPQQMPSEESSPTRESEPAWLTNASALLQPQQANSASARPSPTPLARTEADALVDTITLELAASEARRAEEARAAQAREDELRAELAVRTTAACRMHEQWRDSVAEVRELRAELARAERALETMRAAADAGLGAGMRRSEERTRLVELRRSVEQRTLRVELASQEVAFARLESAHNELRASASVERGERASAVEASAAARAQLEAADAAAFALEASTHALGAEAAAEAAKGAAALEWLGEAMEGLAADADALLAAPGSAGGGRLPREPASATLRTPASASSSSRAEHRAAQRNWLEWIASPKPALPLPPPPGPRRSTHGSTPGAHKPLSAPPMVLGRWSTDAERIAGAAATVVLAPPYSPKRATS